MLSKDNVEPLFLLALLFFLACSFSIGWTKITLLVQSYYQYATPKKRNIADAIGTIMGLLLGPITVIIGAYEIFNICRGRGNKYIIAALKFRFQLALNMLLILFVIGVVVYIIQMIVNLFTN